MIVVLFTFLFTILSAIVDSEHINKKQYINDHISRWLLRSIFFLSFSIISWKYVIISAITFTILFDQMMNRFLHNEWFYIGTISVWDKYWSKHKMYYKLFKILLIIIVLLLIIFN